MSFPAVYAISANSLTAETFRQGVSSLVSGTGVVGGGDLAVTQNGTPNMSVNVAAGQIWMPGTLSSTTGFPVNTSAQTAYGLPSSLNEQGCYFGWNNATVNVTISAADPTNPRIDLIVAYVQDAAYSGASNQGVIGVVTGTAAPSPSAPSAPASAAVLAQIAVPAGASSIVTGDIADERPNLNRLYYRSRAYRAAGLTLGSGTVSAVGCDTVTYNPDGGYSAGGQEYTCPVAGVYAVSGQVSVSATAPGQNIQAQIYKNGAVVAIGAGVWSAASGGLASTVYDEIECAAGDTLALYCYSSAALALATASYANYLTLHRMGPR